jgi:hypothetical protein
MKHLDIEHSCSPLTEGEGYYMQFSAGRDAGQGYLRGEGCSILFLLEKDAGYVPLRERF